MKLFLLFLAFFQFDNGLVVIWRIVLLGNDAEIQELSGMMFAVHLQMIHETKHIGVCVSLSSLSL